MEKRVDYREIEKKRQGAFSNNNNDKTIVNSLLTRTANRKTTVRTGFMTSFYYNNESKT